MRRQGMAHVEFELAPLLCGGVHAFFVDVELTTAFRLGGVERHIGALQQHVGRRIAMR